MSIGRFPRRETGDFIGLTPMRPLVLKPYGSHRRPRSSYLNVKIDALAVFFFQFPLQFRRVHVFLGRLSVPHDNRSFQSIKARACAVATSNVFWEWGAGDEDVEEEEEASTYSGHMLKGFSVTQLKTYGYWWSPMPRLLVDIIVNPSPHRAMRIVL